MRAIFEANKDEIAGVILEPVVGNSGFIPPTQEFLEVRSVSFAIPSEHRQLAFPVPSALRKIAELARQKVAIECRTYYKHLQYYAAFWDAAL